MRVKRSQYQQGSIRKVRKAKGYAWEVRFSEWLNGKRYQRTMTLQGTEANAKFGAIMTLYRRKFLPSESRLLELKKKLHEVFPADGATLYETK